MKNLLKDNILYENYQVYSPDGIPMFYCGKKKYQWYLDRGIAFEIGEKKIQLNFIPKGLGNYQKVYGNDPLENRCVNCGTSEYLNRHHVVPYCYRKFLPTSYKSSNFHDVVSLCFDCHRTYEYKATELKRVLDRKYNAPLSGVVTIENDQVNKIAGYSRTLLKHYGKLPIDVQDMMVGAVNDFIGREYTIDDLQQLSKERSNISVVTHGSIVVNQLTNIQEFIEMWRQHFIDNNSCLYLPKNWNVKNVIIIDDTEV